MTTAALVVRPATPDEAPLVHALLARCGEHLARTRGFTNWVPPYPLERVRDECRADNAARRVCTVWENDALVATWTAGPAAPVSYDDTVCFADRSAPALYVNRLAVDPSRQGQGLGDWCTAEIERRARADGYTVVRLDALAANEALLAFYERRGYRRVGTRGGGERIFACLEKALGDA